MAISLVMGCEKDEGIVVDYKLNMSQQYSKVQRKTNAINRNKISKSQEVTVASYSALVIPH